MRRFLIAVSFPVAVLLASAPAAPMRAQDSGPAQSGAPRFWLASASTVKPLDVERTPVLGRRFELRLHGATVKEALAQIVARSGLRLGYSDDILPRDRRVNLSADGITVVAALTDVLFGTGLDVLFTPDGKVTLVRRSAGLPAQGGTLAGRVVDSASGRSVAGAEVLLNGTRWRTETDTAGRYWLEAVDTGSYTLTVRRLGYAKQTRRVTVRAGREDTVNVALQPVAAKLDELVTTATGRQRRRDLGNAITTIRADSVLEHAPIRSLTDLLESRVPGLTTQRTTGAPGDPAKLRLRGLGSAFRSNDPVVIVDGNRVYAAQADARSGNLTNALAGGLSRSTAQTMGNLNPAAGGVPAPSPLDQIDPNIIEKIEVFKGASAATLYGADAANGVIVITTKHGKPGPTQWHASLTGGRTDTPGRYPIGYYRWGHDTISGDLRLCRVTDPGCVQDSVVQFQALNEPSLTILGQGRRTALSLTASGGTSALTYSITGSYSGETGLLKLPTYEADRFRARFNREAPDWMRQPHRYTSWGVTSNVAARLSATADVALSMSLSRSDQRRTSLENQQTPLMGTYIDTLNGRYYNAGTNTFGAFDVSGQVLRDYYVRTTASTLTVTTGLSGTWRPRSWFTAVGNAGLNIVPRNDELFLPAGLVAPTDSGALARGTGRSLVSTFSVRGELRKPVGRGFVFTTSLGADLVTNTTNDLSSFATSLIPGTSSISGAHTITATDAQTNTSVFGWHLEPRISGERFSLSTGIRIDGGSAYGARITGLGSGTNRGLLRGLLALPKLNGSWVLSDEPFFPRVLKQAVSSLRLRGAYGQAQVQPSPLDRLRIYSRPTALHGLLTLTGVGNTHLKPERSTEFEGGFDADLLNSRVSLELTGYRRMQVDALMPLQIPWSVNGGGMVMTNVGNIRNTGVELTAGISPVQLSTVTWHTQLTFSRNRNILTKLGDGVAPQPLRGLVEGYPVASRWALPILGFVDANGDGLLQRDEIQVGDSMVYMGRLQPDYTTVFSTDLRLFNGAVGISASFSYDAGATQINQTAFTNWVLSRALADPTAPPSELASVLAAGGITNNSTGEVFSPATDYGLMQTVSTFRFHSLSVNYTAPQDVAKLLGSRRLTVAVQGANLGLHSTYRGKDPNVNAWSPGEQVVDMGQLPQPRTWQLAVYLDY